MNVLLITLQRTLDVMGLKCIHHFLLANAHNSFMLYLPRFRSNDRKSLDAVGSFVAELSPKLIGISLMAVEYDGTKALTAYLKETFPGVPIVWGGIHPTTAAELCVDHADYLCVGEGERTMLDMANAIEHGQSLAEIPNLCYREDGRLRRNPLHPLTEDLDTLPLVKQISPNSFVRTKGRIAPLNNAALARYMRYGTTVYNVISSRGCPYRCAYCNNSYYHKLYPNWGIRRRSVSHVMAELEHAVQEYPKLAYVNFQDDCFLACDVHYLKELCRQYQRRIRTRMIAKSTPTFVTRERIGLLKAAGLSWFNMGLQTGSERVCRDVYNRQSLPRHFLEAANVLHDYGIAPWYDLIVDNPFETVEDSYQTVETLIETPKPFYPQLFSLSLYWGTDLHERALKECPDEIGALDANDFYVYHKRPINDLIEVATTLHVPLMRRLLAAYKRNADGALTRLALFVAKAYCRFLLRPITYFRVIRISQGGSVWRTLRVLPNYFRVGFSVYFGLFRSGSKQN